MRSEDRKLPSFNYLFFGFYFFVVAALHVLHVILVEPSWTFSRWFFVVFALGESLLETAILVLIAQLTRDYCSKCWRYLFILVAVVLLIIHLVDFPLVRLMGVTVWYATHFVFRDTFENFIELLIASNVPLWGWALSGILIALVGMAGIYFYCLMERLSQRRPIPLRYSTLAGVLGSCGLFLFIWEKATVQETTAAHFEYYEKTLPWKNTFLPIHKHYLALNHPLKEPEGEEEAFRHLDSRAFSPSRRPDIYLFVVESLREDYITQENTPELHRFKQQNIHFDLALSNANATQVSWFSIFFSKFPFYFGKIVPDEWTGGALPLRLLKKMGYQVQVYSSARLGYHRMDQLIFGESRYLADQFYALEEADFNEVYQKDEAVMDKMIEEMGNETVSSGRVFLIFLDATHHDYSWPLETGSYFHPFHEKVNYFKAAVSNAELEGIRNRYRNALRFVDGQFTRFFEALKNYRGGKEAIVMITGDHAEEFYEQGYLFHASGLSHQQTHIPLYFKFGENPQLAKQVQRPICCHMDMFPSVFHYLIGEDLFKEVFQGQSIFTPEYWPYVVTGKFNANWPPSEFFIHNGKEKILARFTKDGDIFNCNQLRILAAKTWSDEPLSVDVDQIKERFADAFDRIFAP